MGKETNISVMTKLLVVSVFCCLYLLLGTSGASGALRAEAAADPSSWANVVSFGAIGNGTADDTAAFTSAISFIFSMKPAGSGVLYIPSGMYLITRTINITNAGSGFTIQGDGWQSQLLWAFAGNLFQWPASAPATINDMLIRDVQVTTVSSKWTTPLAAPCFAFSFPSGLTQSLIHHVKILNSYSGYGVSGIDMGAISDTVEAIHNVFWMLTGTGIRIGKGSEIRISGGRIISLGPFQSPQGAIGIHVTGNNGGVHVIDTDVIGWNRGIVLDSSNGQGSNREIFINQGTIDSNYRGLAVHDNSYIDISGCWAASSVVDNIWTSPSSNPQLVITGGTIFNAGTYGGNCTSECNGITMNGGTLTMTGVEVRNNQGRGIWVPNGQVDSLLLTGLKIFQNGIGVDIIAPLVNGMVITGCFGFQNAMKIPSDPQSLVANNLFK